MPTVFSKQTEPIDDNEPEVDYCETVNRPWPPHVIEMMKDPHNKRLWRINIEHHEIPQVQAHQKGYQNNIKKISLKLKDIISIQKDPAAHKLDKDDLEYLDKMVSDGKSMKRLDQYWVKACKLEHQIWAHIFNCNKNKVNAKLPALKLLFGEILECITELDVDLKASRIEDGTQQHYFKAGQEGKELFMANKLQRHCNRLENLRAVFC